VRASQATAVVLIALVGVGGIAAVSAEATEGAPPPPRTLSKLCGMQFVQGTVVRFPASDGAQLVGAVAGKGRVGVLLASGSNTGICDWVLQESGTINAIVAAGAQVLLFDFRGTGFSPEHPGAASAARDRDVVGAASELRRRGARRVVLVGASSGGIVVLAAATKVKPAAAGIITLSATGGEHGELSTEPAEGDLDGKAAATALRLPLLLVVANADSYAFAPTKTLFAAAGSADKQLLVVPGPTHAFFDDDPSAGKIRSRMLAFIRAHAAT
jgi:pimeloyl-ACP methyl ester carboxylesterase